MLLRRYANMLLSCRADVLLCCSAVSGVMMVRCYVVLGVTLLYCYVVTLLCRYAVLLLC